MFFKFSLSQISQGKSTNYLSDKLIRELGSFLRSPNLRMTLSRYATLNSVRNMGKRQISFDELALKLMK